MITENRRGNVCNVLLRLIPTLSTVWIVKLLDYFMPNTYAHWSSEMRSWFRTGDWNRHTLKQSPGWIDENHKRYQPVQTLPSECMTDCSPWRELHSDHDLIRTFLSLLNISTNVQILQGNHSSFSLEMKFNAPALRMMVFKKSTISFSLNNRTLDIPYQTI
jgi:hypothetical protein